MNINGRPISKNTVVIMARTTEVRPPKGYELARFVPKRLNCFMVIGCIQMSVEFKISNTLTEAILL